MLRSSFLSNAKIRGALNQAIASSRTSSSSNNGKNYEHKYSGSLKPVNLSYNLYASTASEEEAPPLVIMHGLLGSKQNWNSISKALLQKLSPKRRIITLDARNHGESPHSPYHTYPHLAEDIVETFKQLNIEKAAVLGHSMGGRAMMYLALKYPHLVEKAIIVDISPVSSSANLHSMEGIFNAMKRLNLSPLMAMNEGRLRAAQDLMNAIKDKPTVDFILLNLKKTSDGRFIWKANIHSLHNNFKHIAHFPEEISKTHQYKEPVLFIGGSKSNFIQITDLPQIQTIFPEANIKWLDTGHLVQLEKPAEFIDTVVEFLQ